MTNLSKRNLAVGTVLGIGVIALIGGAIHPSRKASATAATVPPIVEVVQAEQKDVPIYGEWIGTLDGLVNADVRAQVTGYLSSQGYQEGSFVRKGQLLFQIDPRPFQAALDQAEGQLQQAKAMADTQARVVDSERSVTISKFGAEAMIEQLRLLIAKYKRDKYGQSAERARQREAGRRAVADAERLAADEIVARVDIEERPPLPLALQEQAH